MAKETYIPGAEILKKIPNRHELNILAARRAHAIERGSESRLPKEETEGHKATVIALKEIEAGLIDMSYFHNQKAVEQRWRAEREQREGKEEVEQDDTNFFPRSSREVI